LKGGSQSGGDDGVEGDEKNPLVRKKARGNGPMTVGSRVHGPSTKGAYTTLGKKEGGEKKRGKVAKGKRCKKKKRKPGQASRKQSVQLSIRKGLGNRGTAVSDESKNMGRLSKGEKKNNRGEGGWQKT